MLGKKFCKDDLEVREGYLGRRLNVLGLMKRDGSVGGAMSR